MTWTSAYGLVQVACSTLPCDVQGLSTGPQEDVADASRRQESVAFAHVQVLFPHIKQLYPINEGSLAEAWWWRFAWC